MTRESQLQASAVKLRKRGTRYVALQCPTCGAGFETTVSHFNVAGRAGRRVTCSKECAGVMRRGPRLGLQERIRRHITVGANGCWIWHGAHDRKGYGQIRVEGSNKVATHIALLAFRGIEVGAGFDACHHCDTPACVNPDHLFVGTRADNMRDCIAKGRFSKPPRSPAPIPPDAVRAMRQMRREGEHLQAIAKAFGVSVAYTCSICTGRARSDVQ